MKTPIVALVALLLVTSTFAQSTDEQPAKALNSLTFPEIVAVTAIHLLSDTPSRQETGKRMSDAIIITGALTAGLKYAVRSPRPEPNQADDKGFPSAHTSLAFATAAALTEREPSAGWIAYPLAAIAGWARHDLRQHTWEQILAGAVLGAYIGHQAGEGELTIFGHNDSSLPVSQQTAEHHNPVHPVGPAAQLSVWGTNF
ncbi:MAG: phosphatase PAP2 family protein [Bacteroidota bacterium]